MTEDLGSGRSSTLTPPDEVVRPDTRAYNPESSTAKPVATPESSIQGAKPAGNTSGRTKPDSSQDAKPDSNQDAYQTRVYTPKSVSRARISTPSAFRSRTDLPGNLNPNPSMPQRVLPDRACKNAVFILQETGSLEQDETSPSSYRAALASEERLDWKRAMQEEITTLQEERGCWKFVPYPRGHQRILRCHFVFKKKKTKHGKVVRYKARLVIDGSGQIQGINYSETFAPVVKYASFRLFCAVCCVHHMQIHQLDVKNAFIYADLDEEINMHPHPEMHAPPGTACLLLRSLYGLKQAPRNWNAHLHDFITSLVFLPTLQDACLYANTVLGCVVFLAVFVDDILVAPTSEKAIAQVKRAFQDTFTMTDEGLAQEFLGVRITQNPGELILDQQNYCRSITRDFKQYIGSRNYSIVPMQKEALNPDQEAWVQRFPYATMQGKIMYLNAITRPDISFAVSTLSRFMAKPTHAACRGLARLLNYLHNTAQFGLRYHGSELNLHAYTDSDWATCPTTRRSITGNLVFLAGAPVAWLSRRQQIVATSSMEAAYIALYYVVQEIVWFRALLIGLDLIDSGTPTTILIDNTSARSLAYNPVHHSRSKHIDVKFHWLREQVAAGHTTLEYVESAKQLADLLTHIHTGDNFYRHSVWIDPSSPVLRYVIPDAR
jgi:hypothetical protein